MNNKAINITLLILIVLFVSFRITTACEQLNQESVQSEIPEELPVTYTGFLPCADCPGIEYYLLLEEDRFTELSWYRDRSETPFEETGTWNLKSDTLKIFDENDELLKTFLYEKDRLTLLDQNQERVTGDIAEMYRIERNQEETSIRNRHNQLRDEEGVDFIASGNEPFWSVRIDLDGSIQHLTPESELTFPATGPIETESETLFETANDSDSLKITIHENYCRDSMSGFLFTHAVTIQLNQDEVMSGCGRYLSEN